MIATTDVSTYVQGHYDLFDNVTFTANASYIRTESPRVTSFHPIRIGGNSVERANGQPIGIAKTNPYNPFGVALVPNLSDVCIAAGSCIGLNEAGRSMTEAGRHRRVFHSDIFHIFAGFNGYVNLLNREIDWDVGFCSEPPAD